MGVKPKIQNQNVGFHYTVTDEQLEIRSKMSVEEILNWVESTARFIYEAQTPEERERMKRAKNFKW